MKRRKFIQTSVVAASTPFILTNCQQDSTRHLQQKIKGFIFSDAHIGWDHHTQPTKETQKQAIQTIVDRFGDLDLVFDTGDVHHGNLLEDAKVAARDFWLKDMAGQFPKALFHYIPGNHELARGVSDVELTVGQLGSFAFRPYYSFDYQGIHFISLPQLQDTILITRETLNWLKQDLELNKDKTTLVFSHNSIKDTTFSDNTTVYRVTVNSDEVTDLLDKHGNVLAWFHGHNHQYEIVKKDHRLYVSNGRIGGFNPPERWGDFGQGHLGGIYFEIDRTGLTVKCFSASENDFFENFGMAHLSNQVANETSFNPLQPVNYYWGHGMAHGNSTYRFYNHYLSHEDSQVFITNNPTTSINTNHQLNFETEYTHAKGIRNKAMGYHIKPRSAKFSKVPDGIQIKPTEGLPFYIDLPVEKYKFDNYLSRSGYYRCGLGANYQLSLQFDPVDNVDIHAQFKVMDKHHADCYHSDDWLTGNRQSDSILFDINIPDQLTVEPYDHCLYLFIKIRFTGQQRPVTLKGINLYPVQGSHDSRAKISITGEHLEPDTNTQRLKLEKDQGYVSMHEVIMPKTLYIKTPDIQWQVRNATANITDNGLAIRQLRHEFSATSQIIITPTVSKSFYVNELINITSCHVSYFGSRVLIDTIKSRAGAMLVVAANQAPSKVEGAVLHQHNGSRHFYKINNEQVLLEFNS